MVPDKLLTLHIHNGTAHNSEEGNTQQPSLSDMHKCIAADNGPTGS